MSWVISLHICSTWETICDAQAGFCTHSSGFCTHSSNSKFLSKFSRKALSGISDQKAPPSPMKNFRFEMTKVYSRIPPPQWKTSDLRWPRFTPEYSPQWKTSDLRWPRFTPEYSPQWKTSDLRWPRFTPEYSPQWKTSDLRWPKFTPEYSPNEKLHIWDDQSLLWNTPPPPPHRLAILEIICGD